MSAFGPGSWMDASGTVHPANEHPDPRWRERWSAIGPRVVRQSGSISQATSLWSTPYPRTCLIVAICLVVVSIVTGIVLSVIPPHTASYRDGVKMGAQLYSASAGSATTVGPETICNDAWIATVSYHGDYDETEWMRGCLSGFTSAYTAARG